MRLILALMLGAIPLHAGIPSVPGADLKLAAEGYKFTEGPAVDPAGNVYFIDQPNGIIGTPDGKLLFVADIGDKKTYQYEISADGKLTNRKLFCEMGSDGMTRDSAGNLYLTGKGVTVFNKDGKKLGEIPVPESWTANVTFGGTDLKTLFITAMDSVYTLEMAVAGTR